MPATSRLFSIIQSLRSAKRPITALQLSEQLEVSLRTIYRDIAELQAQKIPIEGEAGIGYILREGYDMPPLMLTSGELEAALLGAQWVSERCDDNLSIGARSLVEKLNDVIPQHLRQIADSSILVAPRLKPTVPEKIDPELLREAIHSRKKVKIKYTDGVGRSSLRIIWPFMLAYFETVKLAVAWCEKREGFRHFRTDRIVDMEVLAEIFPSTTSQLKQNWWEEEKEKPNFYSKSSLT